MIKFISPKALIIGVVAVASLVAIGMTAGINDAGYRTVVQYPTGGLYVKFTPGPYLKMFGSATEYPDVMTIDFDANGAASGATVDVKGLPVRYRDGGEGTIYGKARLNLPSDEISMIKLHKEARSAQGVAHKIVMSTLQESMTLTAGLMTSEEGYDAKRAIFTQWAKEQLVSGPFVTEATMTWDEDETGKRVSKQIATVKLGANGLPMHTESTMKNYGFTNIVLQLNNPDFEKKTKDQIAKKREATMAIITAKADAEKAKQDAITAEETGKANVMKERYAKEVIKEAALVKAQQDKEVAEIQAAKLVAIATQKKLEAEQEKLAAAETKQRDILEGQGKAEKNRLIIQSDGALDKKLDAWLQAQKYYAEAIAAHKQVPDVVMGAAADGGSSPTADLLSMMALKAAKDLSLDMSVNK